MSRYEIVNDDQVAPCDGGRMSTDTRTWRDATELELRQRDELNEAEQENERLRQQLAEVAAQRDRMHSAIESTISRYETIRETHPDIHLDNDLNMLRVALTGDQSFADLQASGGLAEAQENSDDN